MIRWAALSMALLAGLAGCTQPKVKLLTPPEPPILWPKPPDSPCVQYLGQLKSSEDVPARRGFAEVWDEVLHGRPQPSRLVSPHAVAVHADGARVAIADTNGACVHLFDVDAQTYQRRDYFQTASQAFECPVAVAWVGDALWVADAKLKAVAILESQGRSRLVGRDILSRPAGMAFCPKNERCYVLDAGAHAVFVFDRSGKLTTRFGTHGSGPGQFNYPSHMACGPDGTLVVSDALNFRIQRLAPDGSPLGAFGQKGDAAGDLALPKGVAVDGHGNIWVVDAHFENVQAFSPEGKLLMTLGREGHGPGEFWLPAGICVDAKQRMWIADTYNRRVQVLKLLP